MAIYAIGDIQGCYDELRRLLEVVKFDPAADRLWLTGDLVNRGPRSLDTLRFIKGLGEAAVTVLGNHDLHLIAIAVSENKAGKKDTLAEILLAPDCEELIHWLRHQRLFYDDGQFCLLHAGLPPQWDLAHTRQMALEAEQAIQSSDYRQFFSSMYGNEPRIWREDLFAADRLRFTVNCLTRLRYCTAEGVLDFAQKGAPGTQPADLLPWFAAPGRKSMDMRIIFGHWSTLGFYQGYNCYCIDSGCLWGGQLTALKLGESEQAFQVDCQGASNPLEYD
ncbi:MAG: symmetrical bis(5'-nucleosyl)-tetraphosphatase [Methylomonas sp.]|jgi:bis(5'-nucleosyl)-tetraphosphatase (symmetrical)